jgi:hypothetical protein
MEAYQAMIASRRSFFLGATAFLAAPSIVRVASLMPVSVAAIDAEKYGWLYTEAIGPNFELIRSITNTGTVKCRIAGVTLEPGCVLYFNEVVQRAPFEIVPWIATNPQRVA